MTSSVSESSFQTAPGYISVLYFELVAAAERPVIPPASAPYTTAVHCLRESSQYGAEQTGL